MFEDADVVRCYAHRAPYAPELFPLLAELAPATHAALDLGCGPGKLARGLADHFDRVDAVDPSAAMIEVARRQAPTVRFQQATAETAELCGPYDLVVAGMAMHWMDHELVFGRLRPELSPGAVFAFVEGDSAHEPPWQEQWREMIHRWLRRLGKNPDEPSYARDLYAHEAYVDVAGRRELCFEHRQPLEDAIEREHSRATWARSAMGEALAAEMDDDMRAILKPHCDAADELRFTVCTDLVWGTLREGGRARESGGAPRASST